MGYLIKNLISVMWAISVTKLIAIMTVISVTRAV